VFDIESLLSLAIPATAVVASLIVVRRLAGDQPVNLAVLFGNAAQLPWPRGMQEEEPRPWRFDLLDRRQAPTETARTPDRAAGAAARPAQAGCATG
jgi:hypothetical protein